MSPAHPKMPITNASDFLAGRSCTPISTGARTQAVSTTTSPHTLPMPDHPDPAQRDVNRAGIVGSSHS